MKNGMPTEKDIVCTVQNLIVDLNNKYIKSQRVLIADKDGVKNLCNILNELLDLINRQQAEIEELKIINEHLATFNIENEAEIERLKEGLASKNLGYSLLERERAEDISDFVEDLKFAKVEAIKEYMKILEEMLSQNIDISNAGYQSIIYDMDKAYEEMVGEE